MSRDESYDWIDDAFDPGKEDPLAEKGMTGCSSLAVLLCAIAAVVLVVGGAASLGLLGALAGLGV